MKAMGTLDKLLYLGAHNVKIYKDTWGSFREMQNDGHIFSLKANNNGHSYYIKHISVRNVVPGSRKGSMEEQMRMERLVVVLILLAGV